MNEKNLQLVDQIALRGREDLSIWIWILVY